MMTGAAGKLPGPHIIRQLIGKLQFDIGRHLYGILGPYAGLEAFESGDLAQARNPAGDPLPRPININRALLEQLGDDEARALAANEARRPTAVQKALNQAFDRLLVQQLAVSNLIILKQFELFFAHSLDVGVLRTRASNQNHILLLLPGERQGDRVLLFHEADSRFHRSLPNNLIADNHLWELAP